MNAARQLQLEEEEKRTTLGYKSFEERKSPELVFAFVEPIGGGAKQAGEALKRKLSDSRYNYRVNEITLSEILEDKARQFISEEISLHPLLQNVGPNISETAKRISKLQQLGNKLRELKGYDYLAKQAIQKINEYRIQNQGLEKAERATAPVAKPLRVAHIIRSLKHKDELNLLKAVYGDLFFVIAVSGSYEMQILNYHPKADSNEDNLRIEKEYNLLSKIDQFEGIEHGQQVREVFYKANLFLSSNKDLEKNITSFLDLLFGIKIGSPTNEEYLMFEAFSASLRSTCLSRQVGAAIGDEKSNLVSIGWNDIPAYGGGLAIDNESSFPASLCKSKGECRSTTEISNLLKKIHTELTAKKFLTKKATKDEVIKLLKDSGLSSLIEFSRAIHAEMEAILCAARTARQGLYGGTLYVTTYPCENCVKHILASGITKVVYVEPYPKSRAKAFFSDFIAEENDTDRDKKLVFSQFTGISNQAYSLLFKKTRKRKDENGKCLPVAANPLPITDVYLDSYTIYEAQITKELSYE